MKELRDSPCFGVCAEVCTLETEKMAVLAVRRRLGNRSLTAVFHFSESEQTISLNENISGLSSGFTLAPYEIKISDTFIKILTLTT